FTDNGDDTYTFAPNENFNGNVTVDFTVSDGQGGTDTAQANIVVVPVNDPPVAGDTSFSMNEDGTITLTPAQLLANSSDVEGDVSLQGVSYSGSDGTLSANDDGSFSFIPNENFNGDIVLDVVVLDAEGTSDTAQANIVVVPVNDFPVSGNLAYAIDEDGSITLSQEQLLAQASDVDGDTLTALNLQTANPELTITDNGDGTFTLTPAANFNGDLDISFDVFDGEATVAANIDLTVNPVNDLPVAQDQNFQMNEDGTITLTDGDLLTGASDVDGDTLSISDVAYTGTDGIFTDNGDDTYTFAPNENFNGNVTVDFTVSDGQGGTDTAQANIVVVPVNDPPVSGDLAYAIDEDGSITLSQEQLLAQASDVEGDTLTALNLQTANPELTITDNGDGTFTLTPAANFNGDLDISFDVFDGEATVAANIDLTVNPVNDLPVAQDQNFQMNEDGTITLTDGDLLTGASDVDGDTLSISDVAYTGTDGIFTDNGDDTYTFAPNENFNGNVTVDFTVSDGQGGTDTAQANIVVVPVNDPPVSGDLAYAIDEDGSITLSQEQLLAQASDVDGDTLTALNLQTANPELTITDNGDGTFTLTPAANFNGDLDISFDVFDGEATVAANIDLTVNPVNDLPVAQDQNFQMNEDGTITLTDGDLLTGASDVDGDTLSISDVAYTGTDGIFTDNGDDTYTFAPNENFNGNVTVDFTVSDGQGGTDTAQANIVVVPVNDPPVSGDLAYAIDEDGSITLSQEQLLAQASDVDGDTLTALNLQTANPELTITDNGDGTFTLTPAANFNGDLDISFDVFDGEATVAANIDLTVNPVNDLPVAQDQNFQMNEDGTITLTDGDLLTGASDVDGDTLSISDVAYTGTDGIFTDNGDDTYTFAPNENF
ncbi:tandem-95 repeat protein, partial [Oleiphilus sp. HI0125]|uniref:tandem-95 repeat protein n=1 Tax=Oleiphilus sp. HI0125 TaxID=1822266 RepID=UPI000AE6BE11